MNRCRLTRRRLAGLALFASIALFGAASATWAGDVVDLELRAVRTDDAREVVLVLETTRPDGVGALEIEIAYDPARVRALGVTKGRPLRDGMLEYDLREERVRCVIISGEPVTAGGVLLEVTFEAERDAEDIAISLENLQAWDFDRSLEMRVDAPRGSIDVPIQRDAAGASSSAVPFAIAVGAVLLIILMVWVYRQGRKHASRP